MVTLDVTTMSEQELQREVVKLRAHNAKLVAILRLVVVLLKVCNVTLLHRRVADGETIKEMVHSTERFTFDSAVE